MTLLDIILAIPICLFIFLGWKKGLVRSIATLAGVLLGIWASTHFSQQIAVLLGLEVESAPIIAFIITFLAALILTYLLGRCVEVLMKAVKLSILNRTAGALLGAAEVLCLLSVLLNLIVMIDHTETIIKPAVKEKSIFYKPVFVTGNQLTTQLKDIVEQHKDNWKEAMK